MKYVDEFRDRRLIKKVSDEIRGAVGSREYAFMEVCGTHTMAIYRYGLRELLPGNISLVSGPGCPVCVTPNEYLDKAIEISHLEDVTVTTFGDMMRVPGSHSSLYEEKAKGSSIKAVYSTDDALEMARKYPKRQTVFLGVGFETTAPTVAASIMRAKQEELNNYSVLCGHKTMPEVLGLLSGDKAIKVNGFLLPGHVSAIIGTAPYEHLASGHGKRCVVAGFEPLDIMQAMLMLVKQSAPKVEIQYKRVMNKDGNRIAQRTIDRVFDRSDALWRGIGNVGHSGLKIKKRFSEFDAERRFHPKVRPAGDPKGCLCGAVLKGIKTPAECVLFGKSCSPAHPIGACMVSSEGTCAAYYKYKAER